jgi:hypothetical protein
MFKIKMEHLQMIKQTYYEHFQDSIYYGFSSWKASIYFFIHAFFPNQFQSHGSDIIFKLHNHLKSKLS